jgi:hypothetical protein
VEETVKEVGSRKSEGERAMIFRQVTLDGIRGGTVTLAFRRWRRPSVRAGGTLLTSVGQLGISAVAPVTAAQIAEADAKRAGYASLEALLVELDRHTEGELSITTIARRLGYRPS